MTTRPGSAPSSEDRGVRIIPLRSLPEVREGDDLAQLLVGALGREGLELVDGDVLCVSAKIISKSRGLVIPAERKQRTILEQTVRLVARRRHLRTTTSIVEVPAGPVMAAAGIDGSNAPEGLLVLPEDPDAEAEQLRDALARAGAADVAVVLSDTSSRIWRVGVGDIALGAAGLRALEDLRGTEDAEGRTLHVTRRALADEIAAAADLVKGKASGVPAVIVRGLEGAVVPPDSAVPARALSRTDAGDWFRRPSLESVWQSLGLSPEQEPVAAMDPEDDAVRLRRAIDVARTPSLPGPAPLLSREGGGLLEPEGDVPLGGDEHAPRRLLVHPAADTGVAWASAGMLLERLRVAIGAESIARPLPVGVRLGDVREDSSRGRMGR
ncbi:coenzyme F420-0:L-glutamate ligase [Brachybacterium endophyticum]|uniref:Coenzyme F420-0:L-glutamate ligase n=1 Tax=Brachybacterium endophyticum TaxID=2182385 RepID=A0A2U2RH15_9MICO|nr:coenzyme F420-0:L-glutamate ligase [Brachybacterium endophyticum]PWH05144.1 coenzyme F420-0:L-glutamate ligase [Brachybacterium endophyticum]